MKTIFPIYEFRPYKERNWLRWNKGNPIEDDGEYDIVFISLVGPLVRYVNLPYQTNLLWSWAGGDWRRDEPKHPNGNAWHYMLKEKNTRFRNWDKRYEHPNEVAGREAMHWTASKGGCASGGGPEFHINDPYIKRGLLREKKTKKVIKFPQVFNCVYCGEIKLMLPQEETE